MSNIDNKINLPNSKIIIKDSLKPGSSVVIMAGVHGNEVCGVKALDELIPSLKIVAGKVTFIYANLEAIKQNKRFIDYNMNRAFISEKFKPLLATLEGKTARELMPFLDNADYLLDVHASTSKNTSPFIICEKNSYDLVSSLPFNLVCSGFDYVQQGGSDGYMNKEGKKGVCVECGYLGDKNSTLTAKKAIKSFLTKTGNIRGEKPRSLNKKFFCAVQMYKNRNGHFRKAKDFCDLEELSIKTLIGFDGDEKVFVEKGDAVLFVNDTNEPNKECFIIAKPLDKV